MKKTIVLTVVSVSLWCSKRKKNPPLLTQAAAYKMSSQPYSLSLNISLFWCIFRFAAVARSRWKQTITNKGVCARVECLSFVWPKTAQVLDHLILALLIAANESTCCNECKHPPNACPHFTTQWRHLGTTPLSKKCTTTSMVLRKPKCVELNSLFGFLAPSNGECAIICSGKAPIPIRNWEPK